MSPSSFGSGDAAGRVALCFPGQGSQVPGMAEGLLGLPAAAPLLDAAETAGLSLRDALRGDADQLRATDVAQPAILFVELVLAAQLPPGLDVVGLAGHSVGEYAALAVAGALSPTEAMALVVARGRAMAAMREGGMLALLGVDGDAAEALCAAVVARGELVVVANLNAPGQVVLSGTEAGLALAAELAPGSGVRRSVRLNVGGAFHSPLMAEAAASYEATLAAVSMRDARWPVVCNVDAIPTQDAARLTERLRRQLISPVRWTETVDTLVTLGARTLIEVGPGTVLTGLARRISPGIAGLSATSLEEVGSLSDRLEVAARA